MLRLPKCRQGHPHIFQKDGNLIDHNIGTFGEYYIVTPSSNVVAAHCRLAKLSRDYLIPSNQQRYLPTDERRKPRYLPTQGPSDELQSARVATFDQPALLDIRRSAS